ncbi:hypothetical protein HanRHA438_Chr16g0760571 [Helianthus annuus]|nr:hypothetical protein HanPSC8_Chr16g0717731 [Helianthus annuus]KAJ0835894.1 hypothetical protein HanRHA438_Chr16g0760571 [Helianthus annuus]
MLNPFPTGSPSATFSVSTHRTEDVETLEDQSKEKWMRNRLVLGKMGWGQTEINNGSYWVATFGWLLLLLTRTEKLGSVAATVRWYLLL